MAIVIDALKLVRDKKRLPTEAFFVDTNIVVAYLDPFSQSSFDTQLEKSNVELREIIPALKGSGVKPFSTLSIALEFYKYVQVTFYKIESGKDKFDLGDFKEHRDNDIDFMTRWDNQIKVFQRTFVKTFPLYIHPALSPDVIKSFKGSRYDFGDPLISSVVFQCAEKMCCIFSNDSDFLAFSDELFLLTSNKKIIEAAR